MAVTWRCFFNDGGHLGQRSVLNYVPESVVHGLSPDCVEFCYPLTFVPSLQESVF